MTGAQQQMILTHIKTLPIIGAAMTARRIGSAEIEDLVARRAQLDLRFPVASLPRLASLADAAEGPKTEPLPELQAACRYNKSGKTGTIDRLRWVHGRSKEKI